ncbi:MAG: DNA-binding NarL/FixJ family response regulator [Flavobacteriales bacterium]
MEKIAYNKLKFLIADDFSNFRSTVSDMLVQLGVIDIEMASNTDEIIELCSNNQFNVVLCDYNLGPGRNGQHVLEELRYKSYLRPRDIFILVSAEQSRNIVMSAYDCTPDDYLMKPITTQMLHTRLERILLQRIVLGRAYHAIENDNRSEAIDILIEISLAENRYSTQAQKILGELFIEVNELNKAEKLYRRALEVRELDWARLGLAKVKHLKGELDQAGEWLDKIIDENYLYLPAYDVLSRNWSRRGEKEKAQQVVQRSVDVSPMSILRQKRLAELAEENGDLESAVSALRKTVRLGKDSCHGEPKDVIKLSRTVARAIEEGVELSPASVQEAIQSLDEIEGFFELGQSDRINVALSKSRLFSATGEIDLARDCMDDVEAEMVWDLLSVDAALDQIRSLLSIGNKQQAVLLLELMQKNTHTINLFLKDLITSLMSL